MDTRQFEARKRDHIQHSLDPAHQASGLAGFDRIHLVHEAMPEIDFNDVRLATPCLGKAGALATPFFVSGMTAGHADALSINHILAVACAERGWAMGVGSQRRDLENVGSPKSEWIQLRKAVPDLVLFGNIGIAQLIESDLAQIRKLIENLDAQALAVHLNALQETMQPEGTPRFRGGFEALKRACGELGYPVVLKETGCGFSAATLKKLSQIGLAAIDVSGLGGTHWGRIEGARVASTSIQGRASATFASWGESTVDSVLAARKVWPKKASTNFANISNTAIWASGGVRSGLDAAKLIALGAERVGYAQPALEAALAGPDSLRLWMETQEYELKVALFCTGSLSCEDLSKKEGVWKLSTT